MLTRALGGACFSSLAPVGMKVTNDFSNRTLSQGHSLGLGSIWWISNHSIRCYPTAIISIIATDVSPEPLLLLLLSYFAQFNAELLCIHMAWDSFIWDTFSPASWRTFQCSVLYNFLLGFFHMFVASLYRVKPSSFFSQNSWKKKTQFFCLTFIPRDVTFWEHKGQCCIALPAVSGTRPLCCGILL